METIVHMTTFCLFLFRSYRTYEEWKPTFLMFTPPSLLCSYRTYEEWKRGHGHFISSVKDSSYRTYEEWKLWNHKRSTQWRLVLTVPMRNGNNDIHRVNSPWVLQVLTVPMRNGNSVPSLQFRWVCSSFLPYLWGMETYFVLCVIVHHRKFLPYLWGMETDFEPGWVCGNYVFLPYLWGMETPALKLELPVKISSYRTYEEWKPVATDRDC